MPASLVVAPTRPGRRVLVMPATPDPSPLARVEAAQAPDIMLVNNVYPQVRAVRAVVGGGKGERAGA